MKSGRREFSGNIAMSGIDNIGHVSAAWAQRDEPEDPGEAGIVVLCTANVCRSPMAAPLLARRLATLGVTVPVRSAGMIGGGDRPHPEVVSVMASYGIEIGSPRSRIVCAADLALGGLPDPIDPRPAAAGVSTGPTFRDIMRSDRISRKV